MLLALVGDIVHFCGLAASAGGRDSAWTSSGVSFIIINLGRVTKSTNILAFCGGGPVLIFATDFSLILKLVGISRGGGTAIIIVFIVRHRGYHPWVGLSEVSQVPRGCWTWHPSKLSLRSFLSTQSIEMETPACQGGGPLCQVHPFHWEMTFQEMTLQGFPSGCFFFYFSILLRPHQALTRCPHHCFSRNLHTLGWP